MRVKSRHDVSARELKRIRERIRNDLGEDFLTFLEGRRIETCTTDLETDMIFVEGEPRFFLSEKMIFPTLKAFMDKDVRAMPFHVTVDMGAVPYVVNGADIMRPGIVDMDTKTHKDDFVIITESANGRPLAVGKLLYDASEIMGMKEGKVVKNLHFVGDKMWGLEGK